MAELLPTKSYRRIPVGLELPKLIQVQMDSFLRLKREGFTHLFGEISPIESYNKGMQLYFPANDDISKEWELKYWFEEPKNSIEECLERDLTYASPLYVSVLLKGKDVPEPIKSDLFLGDFPEMTPKGTFIINGTERVVVSQLIRSPGVYFEREVVLNILIFRCHAWQLGARSDCLLRRWCERVQHQLGYVDRQCLEKRRQGQRV